ncbi:MAG: NAD-dependent epimerase/dehydratase family protein [Betaproteobacteria bacterium]|nr:NAD-dependent epimerase/dehydratase family protein [Betaproteobacteria bacterium]
MIVRALVTGAAGFIGEALVRALAARPDVEEVVAVDQAGSRTPFAKVRRATGDLASAQFTRGLVTRDIDAVFHLASLVSGGAERDFELGSKVNLDATRDLLEACRLAARAPTFVFASSIAVYGGELPDPVTDATPPSPRISYGAQKLVCEVLLNDYTRRGYVDGRALRLPTIMVRPGAANTAVSGWASAIVREPLAGRDYVCPVRGDTRMACLSLGRTVEALLRAAELPAAALGFERALLLTGIPVTAEQMWAAVRRNARGRHQGNVVFRPDEAVQRIMDAVPRATRSERAARLGFRPNASIDEIVGEYLRGLAGRALPI